MNCRSFVAAVSAGLVVSAGCSGFEEQLARLAWIDLRNDREEKYEVVVTVEDEGEMLFTNTYHLGADAETATVLEETPVDGEGRYVVHATLDDEEREVDTMDFIDGSGV